MEIFITSDLRISSLKRQLHIRQESIAFRLFPYDRTAIKRHYQGSEVSNVPAVECGRRTDCKSWKDTTKTALTRLKKNSKPVKLSKCMPAPALSIISRKINPHLSTRFVFSILVYVYINFLLTYLLTYLFTRWHTDRQTMSLSLPACRRWKLTWTEVTM